LYIHATKTEKADAFYAKHLGGLLQPPFFKSKENDSTKKQTKEELAKEGIEVTESKEHLSQETESVTESSSTQETTQPKPTEAASTEVEELPLVGSRKGDEFPPLVSREWELEGHSWTDAFVDVVYAGLGWVSLTGKGKIKIRSWGVKGAGIYLRDSPLMPFETPTAARPKVKPIKY
jgi:hypothetical protein